MEREASPDWLRDFKSPTEDACMILSSSPSSSSREMPERVSTKESLELDTENEIGEDSPLISALVPGKTVEGAQPKEGMPKRRGRPPGSKNKISKEKSTTAKEINIPEDDDEDDEKVVSSRAHKGGKKLSDSDGDEEEFKPPTKIRKTAPSSKVKKEGAKTPNSSRRNKRVSVSEDQETARLKRVKRELELKPVDTAAGEDEDDEDETAPISKLSAAKTAPDSAGVPKSSNERPGTNALRALVEDEVVDDDGLGLSQVGFSQDLVAAEEMGELSERKLKRISSTLPLIFADKIHRTKVLLECEDDALDLSGDMGAVGRFTVTGRDDGDDELSLDLKGVVYKTTIVPTNTFFVVNVGQTEAKVEAIMNDFMQLRPDANQAGDETVVEGTLEDFGFDVDNHGDGGSAPNGTPAPAEDDDEEYGEKPRKKSPTKGQGKKVGASKAAKAKPKASGRGGAKRPRGKVKTAAKKPVKARAGAPRKPKATKG